jgi:hypothetical protein
MANVKEGVFFLDTKSMKLTEIPLVSEQHVSQEMAVCWADRASSVIEVRDPKNHWIINVKNAEENDYIHRQISLGSGRLVEYTRSENCGTERIRVWRMGNPPTLIHDRTRRDPNLEMYKVDEQFIAAKEISSMFTTLYFISTETLEEFRTRVMLNCQWEYNRGLLFQTRVNGIVQILEVVSRTYLKDLRLPFRKEDEPFVDYLLLSWASSNSNVIVIGWNYKKDYDESEIACMGENGRYNQLVTVLKLANFSFAERKSSDLKANSRANDNIKVKVIYGHCVDSYPYIN